MKATDVGNERTGTNFNAGGGHHLNPETKAMTRKARALIKGLATGPTTARGKSVSALNALKHGLAAKQVLLPGEDPEEYARRADAVFEALAPRNEAQAELVALIADDIHKLARLERVEVGVLMGRIENLMAQTEISEEANRVAQAIQGFGGALSAWCAVPMPHERGDDLDRRSKRLLGAFSHALELMPDLPVEPFAACNRYTARMADKVAYPVFPADLLAKVYEEARLFLEAAITIGKDVDKKQEETRKAVATISLPDKEELSKLAKYRRLIEEGLGRRLDMLEQLRQNSVAAGIDELAAAREYRLRLRVVPQRVPHDP